MPVTCVVDLPRAGVDSFEQLVYLLFCHLLTEVRKDIFQLADANKTRHVFVEHLEATAIFLRLARVAEAARPIEDALEGLEIDYLR